MGAEVATVVEQKRSGGAMPTPLFMILSLALEMD